jgi:hypothetical protein
MRDVKRKLISVTSLAGEKAIRGQFFGKESGCRIWGWL